MSEENLPEMYENYPHTTKHMPDVKSINKANKNILNINLFS